MLLIDTSIRTELLQGCRDEREWARTLEYLDDQSYLEMSVGGWTEAARVYFELRQRGLTVRSTLDCCIALVAIEHDLTLLHNDRDYETIATVRPLKQQRVQLASSP
jgi:predicted nucleic acid-binding protein